MGFGAVTTCAPACQVVLAFLHKDTFKHSDGSIAGGGQTRPFVALVTRANAGTP